jgi:signal transduction histidine kinase
MSTDASYDEQFEQEIDQRLALVAHELTSPLVIAQTYTGLLADELREDEPGRDEPGQDERSSLLELAERSTNNLEHALHLLQRLRDTAASAEDLRLVRERFDLGRLVADVVLDLSTTVADRHPVTVHVPDHPVWVRADAARIRQILFNLTINAAKYSDDGAAIEVTLTPGQPATLEVRNHGFGVAPADAERLFHRGARGDDSGPYGLGVGLYVSRAIAEAHDGHLHVEPAEVRGSRFILQLPTVR